MGYARNGGDTTNFWPGALVLVRSSFRCALFHLALTHTPLIGPPPHPLHQARRTTPKVLTKVA